MFTFSKNNSKRFFTGAYCATENCPAHNSFNTLNIKYTAVVVCFFILLSSAIIKDAVCVIDIAVLCCAFLVICIINSLTGQISKPLVFG